jgi:periplasmic protein TonB
MSAAPAFPPAPPHQRAFVRSELAAPRFEFLLRSDPADAARRRRTTVTASLVAHAVIVTCLVLVPLLFFEPALPDVGDAVRAFFVMPRDVPPPPPPPPPPAPGPRPVRAIATPQATPPPSAFVAPIEMPDQIELEVTGLDLGIEGGVPGGVEGGVPGGVVGGVVGGLPGAPPPPPAKVVRIGGSVVAPKLVRRVEPVYPELAVQARAQAIIILEAHVGTDGHVKDVAVLRGQPLFDEAALAAVRQWRYQPLLLNGEPTEFLLTVTLIFKIQSMGPLN